MVEKIIFYTDIGTDVDDAIALTFAHFSDRIDIKGVVTTSGCPYTRAQIVHKMFHYFGQKIPIGVGSQCSLDGIEGHITGKEGEGFIDSGFPVSEIYYAEDFFNEVLQEKTSVVALAPLIDLGILAKNNPSKFKNIQRLYIQARARFEGTKLKPDETSYNIKSDLDAAKVVLAQDIPMFFLGKGMAFQSPIEEKDLQRIRDTKHPVGEYIYNSCHIGLDYLKRNVPELYAARFEGNDIVSYPYDPLTVMALAYPEFFEFEEINGIKRGMKVKPEAKEFLLGTIVSGLINS